MNQKMKEYWNGRAKNYDVLFERSPVRFEVMQELLNISPSSAVEILDVGAGTGRLTEHFLKQYPKASFHLLDLSPDMLEQARQRFSMRDNFYFYEGSFETLPLPDCSVDLIISALALHHVPDRSKLRAAKEMHRVLRPDGLAVVADEILGTEDLEKDNSLLNKRMIEVFYPHEEKDFFNRTFSDIQEWPTSLITLRSLFAQAGFSVTAIPINDVVGIIKAQK